MTIFPFFGGVMLSKTNTCQSSNECHKDHVISLCNNEVSEKKPL